MLHDDEYENYCNVMDKLKQRAQAGEQPHRKLHRLSMYAYTASDCHFFFTVCACDRARNPFLNKELAEGIIKSLLWTKQRYEWTLYGYCLMPDHLHFLARLPERGIELFDAGARGIVPKGILDHVGNFKKFTTTQLWWKLGGSGDLWQKSSYDRAILFNRSVEPALRYLLNNPVRRGLVDDWRDYPYTAVVDPS